MKYYLIALINIIYDIIKGFIGNSAKIEPSPISIINKWKKIIMNHI